jgi:DNA topoisomerase-2
VDDDDKNVADKCNLFQEMAERGDVSQDEEEEESEQPAVVADAVDSRLSDFDYLVSMALIKLSEEEKDKLLRESQSKEDEYKVLLSKTWSDLWSLDLDNLIVELDKQEEKERQDEQVAVKNALKKKVVEAGGRGKKKLAGLTEVHPSPHGQRVVPRIDAALIKRAADADKAKENKGTGKVRGKPKKEEDDMDTSSLLERVLKVCALRFVYFNDLQGPADFLRKSSNVTLN